MNSQIMKAFGIETEAKTTDSNDYIKDIQALHSKQLSLLTDAYAQLEQRLEEREANLDSWKGQVLELERKLMSEPSLFDETELDRLDRLDIRTENLVKCWDLFLDEFPPLKQKMERLEKQVGYCIRKVNAALDSDPDNNYLKQIMSAIQDLESKLN